MAWIDFRKASDMVLHSSMIKSLGLVEAAKNIVNLQNKNYEKLENKLNL